MTTITKIIEKAVEEKEVCTFMALPQLSIRSGMGSQQITCTKYWLRNNLIVSSRTEQRTFVAQTIEGKDPTGKPTGTFIVPAL